MTLKIELIEGRIRLIGEFRSERLDQVKAEIDRRGSPVVLDLEELDRCRRHSLSQRVRGEGNLSVALLPLHKSLDGRGAGTAGGANAKEENGTVAIRHEHLFAHPK
jgi:hypothetical protein